MEEESMDQPFDPNDLKQFLSAKLYQNLVEIHSHLMQQTNEVIATDILLTALGVNIGHIVGQLPHSSQKKCLKALRKIIDEQIGIVTELEAMQTHGQVGHA